MAAAAGRRNILRELTSISDQGIRNNSENAIVTATPTSPEETVIQLRGHHKKSATYNYGAADPVFFKTPTKSPKKSSVMQRLYTPPKMSLVRSSPRKHATTLLNKDDASCSTSDKQTKLRRLQNFQPKVELEKTIKALSYSQLIDLIAGSAKVSPEIEKMFSSMLPWPDLAPVIEHLSTLQRNVFKSYPRNIWGSQDSSFCYLRVRTHLELFKKECLRLCNQFMESQHWPTFFEFVFVALKLSIKLPNWENVAHNKIKMTCLKYLVSHFVDALNKADLEHDALCEIAERIKEFADHPEVTTAISCAEDLLKKSVVS
ncbi:uncharacterized protein LOC129218602 [Uloborus diversus]|uniref:uncharacterized protein LOC129218602 n=1 Tax=Uloborus diversus TaxID=327109 RepID=UPI00240A6FF6|nr:uncharacterized protein LOC129218602 [Uloborus diversus]XP_054708896.1 uncharacterized protein LOC129218602 [Uloborus diversus]XP_054708897.1 uncharacterized protein LOC129218602 [Uloborus diversus]